MIRFAILALAAVGCGSNAAPVTPDAAPMPDAAPACEVRAGTYQQAYTLRAGQPPFCTAINPGQFATDGSFTSWSAAPPCDPGCSCTSNRASDVCTSDFDETCTTTGFAFVCHAELDATPNLITGTCSINLSAPSPNIGSCLYDLTISFLHP